MNELTDKDLNKSERELNDEIQEMSDRIIANGYHGEGAAALISRRAALAKRRNELHREKMFSRLKAESPAVSMTNNFLSVEQRKADIAAKEQRQWQIAADQLAGLGLLNRKS